MVRYFEFGCRDAINRVSTSKTSPSPSPQPQPFPFVTFVSFKRLTPVWMDSDAFEKLKHGSEKDISMLYHLYLPSYVGFICKEFRCTSDRAEEMYPETFSIVYFNIRNGKLTAPLKSTIQTYLNSTGWNLYHRRYLDKYNREKIELENVMNAADINDMVDEAMMQKERAVNVKSMLEIMGDPCRTILIQIYYEEADYKELSLRLNLPENTLRKRKFDCLGKMRKLIQEHNIEL